MIRTSGIIVTFVKRFSTSSAFGNVSSPSVLRGVDIKQILSYDKKAQFKRAADKRRAVKVATKPVVQVTGPYLNDKYRDKLTNPKPSASQLSHTNRVFDLAKKKLNWAIYKYEDIPGENDRMNAEEIIEEVEREEEDEFLKDELPKNEQDRLNKISKRERILQEKANLPEVMFIGSCNVGKSSLINALFNDLTGKRSSFIKYANVKRFRGLTQSLNFYNVGGLLRVVDTPGYGVKGTEWQGELVLKYLENRRNLRRVFVLVNYQTGFKQTDDEIVGFLLDRKIPFEIVFTKIDKLVGKLGREAILNRTEELMSNLAVENRTLQPSFFFTNNVAETSKRKTGIDEIRFKILQVCGYENLNNLKPLVKADPKDLEERSIRRVGELDETHDKREKLRAAEKKNEARQEARRAQQQKMSQNKRKRSRKG